MVVREKRVEALVSELSTIEFENGRLLDDELIRLIAQVRSQNLLNDDEWISNSKVSQGSIGVSLGSRQNSHAYS